MFPFFGRFVTHIFNVYLTKNETADNIEMECMMKLTEDAPKSRWIEDYELEDWETVGLFPEYLKIGKKSKNTK